MEWTLSGILFPWLQMGNNTAKLRAEMDARLREEMEEEARLRKEAQEKKRQYQHMEKQRKLHELLDLQVTPIKSHFYTLLNVGLFMLS